MRLLQDLWWAGSPCSFDLNCRACVQTQAQEEPAPPRSAVQLFDIVCGAAGVLAARAASTVTGRASEDTGIRIESIIKAGLTGPMAEALAMYYQVRLRRTLVMLCQL